MIQTDEEIFKGSDYVNTRIATKKLGIHARTLHQWDKKGWIDTIRTPGNHRMYNVKKYLMEKQIINEENYQSYNEEKIPKERMNIIYARVFSLGQKNDLERQKNKLINMYPNHFLVEDIGSGMNMNRRGFRKIIDWIIEGKVNEVVVIHKDRLARFGYDLFEDLLKKYSNGTIQVVENIKDIEPEEELVKDVLQVMNIFVAKMNGMRKYKNIK
jgi:predicted site-specific integrase-resolvase